MVHFHRQNILLIGYVASAVQTFLALLFFMYGAKTVNQERAQGNGDSPIARLACFMLLASAIKIFYFGVNTCYYVASLTTRCIEYTMVEFTKNELPWAFFVSGIYNVIWLIASIVVLESRDAELTTSAGRFIFFSAVTSVAGISEAFVIFLL